MIALISFFISALDLLEIVGRNPVRQIDIVIKPFSTAALQRTALPARFSETPLLMCDAE
jgi:hypothetical protein